MEQIKIFASTQQYASDLAKKANKWLDKLSTFGGKIIARSVHVEQSLSPNAHLVIVYHYEVAKHVDLGDDD